jgi:glycosyltransferase involved in cell wall biosynthesis
MKILHLSTSDAGGGAFIAAYRLHKGLCDTSDAHSFMIVQRKKTNDSSVLGPDSLASKLKSLLYPVVEDYLRNIFRKKGEALISFNLFSSINIKKIKELNPDIVHIHWVYNGFISPEVLVKINKPIVWTFHDMWAFCGGEHYSNLDRYVVGYKKNNSSHAIDSNKWIWSRKKKFFKNHIDFNIIAPSKWMAECSRKSFLLNNFNTKVIPNGIDVNLFTAKNKKEEKLRWGLNENKKIILFGAVGVLDPRKGFDFFRSAIKNNIKIFSRLNCEIVIFGSDIPEELMNFGIKTTHLGRIKEQELLAQIYSAADVMIVPSLEDNLPNTVMEAMSCGTPVVGFNTGGISDMIEHKKNGYIAKQGNGKDLARGMVWILENEKRGSQLSRNARKKVKDEFDIRKISQIHLETYKEILKKDEE